LESKERFTSQRGRTQKSVGGRKPSPDTREERRKPGHQDHPETSAFKSVYSAGDKSIETGGPHKRHMGKKKKTPAH